MTPELDLDQGLMLKPVSKSILPSLLEAYNEDPVAAQTLMYVARLVPSAPSKEGARKRQILPSTNSVGTVRKNVSLRGLQ